MKLPFSNQQFATYLIFRTDSTALRITDCTSMMRTAQPCALKSSSLLWIGTRRSARRHRYKLVVFRTAWQTHSSHFKLELFFFFFKEACKLENWSHHLKTGHLSLQLLKVSSSPPPLYISSSDDGGDVVYIFIYTVYSIHWSATT